MSLSHQEDKLPRAYSDRTFEYNGPPESAVWRPTSTGAWICEEFPVAHQLEFSPVLEDTFPEKWYIRVAVENIGKHSDPNAVYPSSQQDENLANNSGTSVAASNFLSLST